jgi:5-methylcytosine-specific restriction endonuclease McrA
MRHMVTIDDPAISSRAAYVLLSQKYKDREVEEWIALKRGFLKKTLEKNGDLICHYCGKTGLRMEPDPSGRKLGTLATIDHVVPISKGGKEKEESNFVIACWSYELPTTKVMGFLLQ